MDFQKKLNKIILERGNNLPRLEQEMEKLETEKPRSLLDRGQTILDLFNKLQNTPNIPATIEIDKAIMLIENGRKSLKEQKPQLEHLKRRFERKTINIGVSGQVHAGKSTLLQSLSGLGDDQIPTGDGLPVTAVRSRIFNQSKDESAFAVIKFYDETSFFKKYIKSHLDTLAQAGWDIHDLSAFAGFRFPDTVDSLKNIAAPTAASNSLKKLREAQEALESFRTLLTGDTIELNNLKDLRQYTTYPTNEQINAKDTAAMKRLYLAVEDIQIFCSFPRVSGTGFGLVDLPGLGEASKSVAAIHIDGLENEVDHVLIVLRPGPGNAFVGNELVRNIDYLHEIQKNITKPGDFASIIINDDGNPDPVARKRVKALQDDITRNINNGVPDSKYKVMTINARKPEDAGDMLNQVLDRLTEALPEMDKEVLDAYLVKQKAIETDLLEELSKIDSQMEEVSRLHPSDIGQTLDSARKLRGELALLLHEMRDTLKDSLNENTSTDDKEAFFGEVERIYQANNQAIEAGLWKGEAWEEYAQREIVGGKNPEGFFGDECNRLRILIAQSFENMNRYYDTRLERFMDGIAAAFRSQTGALLPADCTGRAAIRAIYERLRGTNVRIEHLEAAFKWLSELRFDFRQHVFPEIREALSAIESFVENRKPQSLIETANMPVGLEQQAQYLKRQLVSHATEANYAIYSQLKDSSLIIERVIFAALEYFDDLAIRAEDWLTEYSDFCDLFRDEIWLDTYKALNPGSALFKAVHAEIVAMKKIVAT
jgi:energy-coupling factor transporter ATP-binding protein EcfA2